MDRSRRSADTILPSNIFSDEASANSKSPYDSGKKSFMDPLLDAKVKQITESILRKRGVESQGYENPFSTISNTSPIISRYDPIPGVGNQRPAFEDGKHEWRSGSKGRGKSPKKSSQSPETNFSSEKTHPSKISLEASSSDHFTSSSEWIDQRIHRIHSGSGTPTAKNIQKQSPPTEAKKSLRERFCPRKTPKTSHPKQESIKLTTPNTEVETAKERNSALQKKRKL